MTAPGFRSGFVGLIGRPNVGKSTMMNWFLREKVAIVSPKPQTTRQKILGVLTREDAQINFLDTPGIHDPEHALGRYMVEHAKAVVDDADVLVTIIDARVGIRREDERVFDQVKRSIANPRPGQKRTALLAINKSDAVRKPKLLPLLADASKLKFFEECIPVSALTGDQMDVLLARIIHYLPEGPQWYGPEQRTDQPIKRRVSELVREQILLATHEEVPHAVAVQIEQWDETDKVIKIEATILVEREGQKAIMIGKGGLMLKKIGQEARKEIERLLGRKVFLGLWVKVSQEWRGNDRMLHELGYTDDLGQG